MTDQLSIPLVDFLLEWSDEWRTFHGCSFHYVVIQKHLKEYLL